MSFPENIATALVNVLGHKLRSSLTMLGIIIGIGSVILITAVGAGVKSSVFDAVNTINSSFVQVYPQYSGDFEMLTLDDAEAITQLSNVTNVAVCSEWSNNEVQMRGSTEVKTGALVGADEFYRELEDVTVRYGRFLSANDVDNAAYVTVVRADIALAAFGREDCVGEKLEVSTYAGTVEFTVVGVLKGKEDNVVASMMSTPLNRSVAIIPITTINEIFNAGENVDYLGVGVADASKSSATAGEITRLLDIRHGTEEGFRAESMETSFDQIDSVLNIITGFVAFVAAISLFVGGVGVMNIMLVTVKERTREIGVRKSLGATNGAIQLQFIIEAVILCLLGGGLGILLGGLGASGIGAVMTAMMGTVVAPVVDTQVVAIAFGVSTLVGVVFGSYPAGKAARLDPIESLRYE